MYCMIQNSFGEAHLFPITSHKNSDLVMDTRKEYRVGGRGFSQLREWLVCVDQGY